jgi:hypothetical protein
MCTSRVRQSCAEAFLICRVGLNLYLYDVYKVIFGREITKCTIINGVYIYGSGQPY